jgi:hypothetical protein
MAAQGVHAAAGAADVAQQQLENRGRANDLRAGAVLRPADGVDDGGGLLHVTALANGGEQVGRLEELILGNARDALDDLRRVARVLTSEQLVDAPRMLKRHVVRDVGRQDHRSWRQMTRSPRSAAAFRAGGPLCGIAKSG